MQGLACIQPIEAITPRIWSNRVGFSRQFAKGLELQPMRFASSLTMGAVMIDAGPYTCPAGRNERVMKMNKNPLGTLPELKAELPTDRLACRTAAIPAVNP